MSTRSTIAILNKDNSMDSIYCHSDGYLSYNGMLLFKHFQEASKVKKMISFGDMSSLQQNVDIPEGVKHSFENRVVGISIFYNRDRGESEVSFRHFKSFEDYVANNDFQGYDYVFKEAKNTWHIMNNQTGKLQKLLPKLLKDTDIKGEDREHLNMTLKAREIIKNKDQLEEVLPAKEEKSSFKNKI